MDIEMPGQHVSGDEPVPDSTVYVERISSSVVVLRRHSSSFRRLGFIGSDGRTRFFIVQVGLLLETCLHGVVQAAACSSAGLLPIMCRVHRDQLQCNITCSGGKCMSAVCCVLCIHWAALPQHRTRRLQTSLAGLLASRAALQMGSTGTAPHSISCTVHCGSTSLPQSGFCPVH